MRFVTISDTHCHHRNIVIPKGDVLIHSGDLTGRGGLEELRDFNDWLGELDFTHKIVIAGNHDFCFMNQRAESEKLLTNATYLQDASVKIKNIKIYGSPWQPWFFDWAFNLKRGEELKRKWNEIPIDTDILITHGPPYHILDQTRTGKKVGCEDLSRRIHDLKIKVHIFGHIHEGYGECLKNGVHYINASSCDLGYQAVNAPICFEWDG